MWLDHDGMVVRTVSSRSLAVSNSPLSDTLQALLQGPTAEERQRGLVSFIPPGTRILDIRIRGTTAYINFSEEFQFGIFGAEGYAAQLRQIIWTATEFPTVKDVQILIEGRVVNFLGESILIGSPISREALY
jgi:spore germination protein GerM